LLGGDFARDEFELKDGPKGRRRRRDASRLLDFKFVSRVRSAKQTMTKSASVGASDAPT
jgi:hypothetical protein